MGRQQLPTRQSSVHSESSVLPSVSLQELHHAQQTGRVCYGEYIYPPSKRARVCPVNPLLAHIVSAPVTQEQPRALHPRELQPAFLRDLQVAPAARLPFPKPNPAHSDLIFLDEENVLLTEARSLGKPWSLIAKMLPGKDIATLKRQLQLLQTAQGSLNASHANHASHPPGQAPQFSRRSPSIGPEPPDSASAGKLRISDWAQRPFSACQAASLPLHVNARCLERAGGDTRVQFMRPLPIAPRGTTVMRAHQLASLQGVNFFEEVSVRDPDSESRVYVFSLARPDQCACFNIGEGADGSPLISWSDLTALYQLPDGSKWAEHGMLYDAEDLEAYAAESGRDHSHLLNTEASPQELYKRAGRFHSRLQNVEEECWVFKGSLPVISGQRGPELLQDAYFWRKCFHPITLEALPP